MIGTITWTLIGLALSAYNTWNMTRIWKMIRSGDRSWLTVLMFLLCAITGPVLLVYIFLTDIV